MSLINPHNDPAIAEIIEIWRLRQRWHRAEKALILQAQAICRYWTAGDKNAAKGLFKRISSGDDNGVDSYLLISLAPFIKAIANFKPERLQVEARLEKLATQLPISPLVQSIKGFGILNLAGIIGECGDIGTYRNHSCIWKRMGLAVIDGERQRKKTDKASALLHGYNPSRRAVAFNISDTILKAQVRNVKDADGKKTDERIALGPLGELYIARKALETAKTTNGIHADKRARRYIVKRALRDLYHEWRKVSIALPAMATSSAPSAEMPATFLPPLGQGTRASISHSVAVPAAVAATVETLKDHFLGAATKSSIAPRRKASASICALSSQIAHADAANTNALKGAGRTNSSTPMATDTASVPSKSVAPKGAKRAIQATPKKAMQPAPASHSVAPQGAGRARRIPPKKAKPHASSRKSNRNAA